ncbi:hypothetical protein DH2020_022391 [Rehmannia glutinosa]|uniref:Stress enhanced protein n=1 Tax=Rehmannia glutinosa TaxID=99300 RepID=A0ABR0WFH5_REHGL
MDPFPSLRFSSCNCITTKWPRISRFIPSICSCNLISMLPFLNSLFVVFHPGVFVPLADPSSESRQPWPRMVALRYQLSLFKDHGSTGPDELANGTGNKWDNIIPKAILFLNLFDTKNRFNLSSFSSAEGGVVNRIYSTRLKYMFMKCLDGLKPLDHRKQRFEFSTPDSGDFNSGGILRGKTDLASCAITRLLIYAKTASKTFDFKEDFITDLIKSTIYQRNATCNSKSLSVRCEQSTKEGNGLDVWLGRLAMAGFAAAITVEIVTGKGLLENFGLTSPLPTVALAIIALVGVLTAVFIFQSASKN